jgi:4'-phosphopantetheinyl transferase EntD
MSLAVREIRMPDSELSLPALLPANDNAFVTVAREAKCRIDRLLSAMPDGHPQDGIIIRFDAEAFDPSLYQRFGIIRPDAIARSVVKRQAEFFYGRLAARLALAGQDMNHVNLPVGRSREPVWPAGWTGSISHTTGIAGAIVAPTGSSRCKGIGLDLDDRQLRQLSPSTSCSTWASWGSR